MKETTKEKVKSLFTGDITLPKRELWLIGGICLFAGIVYGLVKAPMTHGFSVSCGNNNGNNNGTLSDDCDCDCDCDEDCECDDDCCCEE